MPRKVFVDKHVKADDLVVCVGEIDMVNDKLVLEGNYVIAFRGMENIWKEPRPAYIDPDDVPDAENNAY